MSNSFATLGTIACQAPLSMELLKQEYWSGLPFLSPGDLPNAGIEPMSPELAGRFFTTDLPGKSNILEVGLFISMLEKKLGIEQLRDLALAS